MSGTNTNDDKIDKLQAATDDAEQNMLICQQALELANEQLETAKQKYKSMSPLEQETLQVNDTELPDLLETHVRAKQVYETALARFNTNQRYLKAFQAKQQS